MTLQSSGPISFGQIRDEFGLPPNKNLGAYRVSYSNTGQGGSLSGLPLDDGVPQSGTIAFSHFYGKRMNTVVDCYSGGTQTNANARDKYNNFSRTVVIGGYRSPKSSPSNEKIIVNVNKTFQGERGGERRKCALRTGTYGNGIIFRVDIGSSGRIVGAGGDGGDGGSIGSGGRGGDGTSALGLEQASENGTVVVANSGLISAGYGGGGGGGGAHDHDAGKGGGRRRKASGGGGGGGAGLPAGERGKGGTKGSNGSNGSDGGLNSAGSGGSGGNNDGEARGGRGGNGGRDGQNSESGERGRGGEGSGSSGGVRGFNGAAIRTRSGVNFSVSGGTVRGNTGASGVQ